MAINLFLCYQQYHHIVVEPVLPGIIPGGIGPAGPGGPIIGIPGTIPGGMGPGGPGGPLPGGPAGAGGRSPGFPGPVRSTQKVYCNELLVSFPVSH